MVQSPQPPLVDPCLALSQHHPGSLSLTPSSCARISPRPRSSVPSGRVGVDADSVFPSQTAFRDAVAGREAQDRQELEAKMGRP